MADQHTPRVSMMRSPLGRARGLGSAHAGASTWWAQTLGSIALVPLTLWFIWSMVHMIGATREDVGVWLSRPVPLVLMLATLLITFHHMRIGVETVVEDYVHQQAPKLCALLAIKAVTFLLALTCVVCVLRIGL